MQDFHDRLDSEKEGSYFVCPNACVRLKLETAMEYEFKCQECGQLLQEQDNARTIKNLTENIRKLEEELAAEKIKEVEVPQKKKAPKKKVAKPKKIKKAKTIRKAKKTKRK
ncbi:hypothetical protein HY643_04425 [Candidatus Woesearchaeota archaeon]|nr:hypothetical protein [Candidatus Woesearchaeota archaeon]